MPRVRQPAAAVPVAAATGTLSDSAAAAALMGARIVDSTKKGYRNNLRLIEHYYVTVLHRRRLALPVKLADITQFFAWLIHGHHKKKPPAPTTVRGYKSALLWLYQERKLIIDPLVNLELENMLKGWQREFAQLKANGTVPVFEGKYHLTHDGYCILANALLNCEPVSRMLFGWPFLLLQWNLVARSCTVGGMMMEHISWEGDALIISTPKSKTDQEGAKCFARHVYANPTNPTICPVLALAVLIFTRVIRHDSSVPEDSSDRPHFRIFDGAHSEARFSEVLRAAIASLPPADLPRLGGDKAQLGTHSIRKGAATYCTGMVSGPSTAQVFLRAGWSLGNVQGRYLFAGEGGDQLTGRVVAGLPFNDSTFACLPPHFTDEGSVHIVWTTILPLYPRLPETFKRAVPYLLASICYHENWLRSTLPAGHPLFNTYLFSSGQVAVLKPFVIAGRSRCLVTGMTATGIPPHLILSNEFIDVAKQTQQLKLSLLEKCEQLPDVLTTTMLQRFSVNGAIPVTLDDMKTMIGQVVAQMRAEMNSASTAVTAALSSSSPTSSSSSDVSDDPRFRVWMWKGRMHPVPQGWQFPSTDVKATWNLWHFGHVHDQIRPLRHLVTADLDGTAKQRTLWSKAHGVMTALAQTMVDMEMAHTVDDVTRWSAAESSVAFDSAIVQLVEKLKVGATKKRGRWMEMAVTTLYKYTSKEQQAAKRRRLQGQQAPSSSEEVDDASVDDGTAAAAAEA